MRNKNGISLIMLVITIVILGILASAVILSIKNTSVIDEAESVVFKSDMTTYNDAYDMYVVKKTMQDITFDETNLNLTYKDAEFENIFGKVPDKYKESLKIIKGKLVYITTDKKESEIIEDMGMIPNKMKIANRLVHCTTTNTATSVAYEKSYTSTLTVDTGYTLQKVTVVMGGVDITSSAYNSSSKTITIDKVTDNIVITATTDANTYTITNNLTQVVNSNAATTAKTGTSYTATLTEKTGYTLKTVKVTMAGTDVTSSVYSSSTNTITISSVTGDIIITASASAKLYTVAYNLTNVTTSNLKASATYGSKYITTLAPKTDYEMKSVTVLVNNVDVTKSAYDSSTNTVTINSVVGDVLITAVAVNNKISKNESYIGCFADVDGDGDVDGVIYADLCFTVSGEYGTGDYTQYEYEAIDKSTVKDYEIIQENYSVEGSSAYESKPVLRAVSEGEDRFYVMALEDFNSGNKYLSLTEDAWDDVHDVLRDKYDFGTGRDTTLAMIEALKNSEYSEEYENWVWGAIEADVESGWFVPAPGEFLAFCDAFGITDDNATDYFSIGFYDSACWGGGLLGYGLACSPSSVSVGIIQFYSKRHVRLSITF